jgi:hypothetical protein
MSRATPTLVRGARRRWSAGHRVAPAAVIALALLLAPAVARGEAVTTLQATPSPFTHGETISLSASVCQNTPPEWWCDPWTHGCMLLSTYSCFHLTGKDRSTVSPRRRIRRRPRLPRTRRRPHRHRGQPGQHPWQFVHRSPEGTSLRPLRGTIYSAWSVILGSTRTARQAG